MSLSRIALVGTDRRIALEELAIDSVPVTELEVGESVAYAAYLADKTTVLASGDASHGLVRVNRPGTIWEREIFGWYADIDLPDVAGLVYIQWTVRIGAVDEKLEDRIDVKATVITP